MSFLSDAIGNRQLVLLCARLLVQGAMGHRSDRCRHCTLFREYVIVWQL